MCCGRTPIRVPIATKLVCSIAPVGVSRMRFTPIWPSARTWLQLKFRGRTATSSRLPSWIVVAINHRTPNSDLVSMGSKFHSPPILVPESTMNFTTECLSFYSFSLVSLSSFDYPKLSVVVFEFNWVTSFLLSDGKSFGEDMQPESIKSKFTFIQYA